MSGKQSFATERALALVDSGKLSAYAAAQREGIALSTIYRALARRKTNKKRGIK